MVDNEQGQDSFESDNIEGEDKTPEQNEKDPLEGIPSEDEDTEAEKGEEEGEKKDKGKKSSSDIAQKIKYRQQLRDSEAEKEALKKENEMLKKQGGGEGEPAADDKETQARNFIKNIATEAVTEALTKRQQEEDAQVEEFESKLNEAVSNSDFTENQILDACDSFNVPPDTAVEILKRYAKEGEETDKEKKPKVPQSRRTPSEGGEKKKDDSKKTLFQIAQEVKKSLTS